MSYDPTTWATGDTITAAKLNKVEQGIVAASSSGGGNPTALVHSSDFSRGTYVGWFAAAKWDESENEYVQVIMNQNSAHCYYNLYIGTGSREYMYPSAQPLNLPDGYVLVWAESNVDAVNYEYSGDISDEQYNFFFGSTCKCRVVTGNFEVTLTPK